jgi:hypothetical protein
MKKTSSFDDRATFYADKMHKIPDSEQISEPFLRVRLVASAGGSAVENDDYSKPPAASGIADGNFKNLQQSVISMSKENELLKDQLSTIAELKAQGDSLEMQVFACFSPVFFVRLDQKN